MQEPTEPAATVKEIINKEALTWKISYAWRNQRGFVGHSGSTPDPERESVQVRLASFKPHHTAKMAF